MTDLRPSILDALKESGISDSLKTVIFRILQEALHNISKHSKAEFVSLSLARRNGVTELVIEDNGEGFNVETVLHAEKGRGGIGLASMKERTELLGGSFQIESLPGEGTIIRSRWTSKE